MMVAWGRQGPVGRLGRMKALAPGRGFVGGGQDHAVLTRFFRGGRPVRLECRPWMPSRVVFSPSKPREGRVAWRWQQPVAGSLLPQVRWVFTPTHQS